MSTTFDYRKSAQLAGPSPILSQDTLRALDELGNVLECVHQRMVSEGYELVDGKIRKAIIQKSI